MKMVDGVVLVVDAYEGTMPQTRFVLKKALEQDLVPIVVVNKIDKPSARPAEVVDEVLELFIELGADDDQLDFPVVYASAINGTSSLSDDPADQEATMAPIFDTIIDHIPAPVDNSDEPLQFQVSLLDYNDFVGRIGIGPVSYTHLDVYKRQDEIFFKGHLDYLRKISSQVTIPTLNKDFIIDEKQIVRARNAGATVILLIVAALSEKRLQELYDFATGLGLEVLVETHNLAELEIAHRIGAQIIGVNNRNLVTFETDINTSLQLSAHFKDDRVYVSESAIFSKEDAELVSPYFLSLIHI